MKKFLRKFRIFAIVIVMANLFFSSAAFGQAVSTDLDDYPPGATAIITGTGFQPGEIVELHVEHADGEPLGIDPQYHEPWTVTTNSIGEFTTSWFVPSDGDALGATFLLSAHGNMGSMAEWTFTDATWTLGLSSSTFCNGETKTITFSITQTNNASRNQSISISVPSGFTISSPSMPSISGKSWSSTLTNATTVCLTANNPVATNQLDNNNVMTFTANVTASNVTGTFALTGNGGATQTCATSGGQAITNPPSFTVSGSSGIYESYAILNLGSGNVFYDLNATTGNLDFNNPTFEYFLLCSF